MLTKTTKNRFAYKLDKIFWFFLSFLPVFSWFIYNLSFGKTSGDIYTTFSRFLIEIFGIGNIPGVNVVYKALSRIFSYTQTVIPEIAFLSDSMTQLFTWMIMIEILHVFFDVIVFIPRLAHKWISKAVQDD